MEVDAGEILFSHQIDGAPMAWKRATDAGDGTYTNAPVYQRWLIRQGREMARKWLDERGNRRPPVSFPVEVVLHVYLQRPQHRPSQYPRELWALDYCPAIGRADVDNYAGSVLDALSRAGIWTDDTRCARLHACKWWLPPGVEAQRMSIFVSALKPGGGTP